MANPKWDDTEEIQQESKEEVPKWNDTEELDWWDKTKEFAGDVIDTTSDYLAGARDIPFITKPIQEAAYATTAAIEEGAEALGLVEEMDWDERVKRLRKASEEDKAMRKKRSPTAYMVGQLTTPGLGAAKAAKAGSAAVKTSNVVQKVAKVAKNLSPEVKEILKDAGIEYAVEKTLDISGFGALKSLYRLWKKGKVSDTNFKRQAKELWKKIQKGK